MSTSGDRYITKDDIIGYLEEREPSNFDDAELEHCYDMMEQHWERHLEKVNDETDLGMAKYWLTQAWLVEGEVDKAEYPPKK